MAPTQHTGSLKLIHLGDGDVLVLNDKDGNRVELYTNARHPSQNQAQIFQRDMQPIRTSPENAQRLITQLESTLDIQQPNAIVKFMESLASTSPLKLALEQGVAVQVNAHAIGDLIPTNLRFTAPGFNPRSIAEPQAR